MSDTVGEAVVPAPGYAPSIPSAGWTDLPMSIDRFLATLGPQPIRDPKTGMVTSYLPGSPDEVFSKLLLKRNRMEKHTLAGWRSVVDAYRGQPAHPSAMP